MAETKPAPSIIEGTVKFRDGKKWKSRWCVMRKLSPVADCVHLQLYKDNKERQKNGQTKASLSLQHFLGFESGFTLDKESNTLAILCEDVIPLLAFDTREILIQWRVKVQHNLGTSREFSATVISSPAGSGVRVGPVRLHARAARLAACAARPPTLLALWDVKLLRRYGVVEGRLCVEGGSRCGRGAGLFVFAAERARELVELLSAPAPGDAGSRMSIASRNGSILEKRFSDTSSCIEEACCHNSMRSVSPAWNVPASHTHACISDLDTSLDGDHPRRPNSLPRCSSCLGKFGGPLTRSSTLATTPGGVSLLNPAWIMDNITEKRSDSDRASIYSRSSGSASEYSVPRGGCILDKSFDSKRSSPVGCCTPTVPVKMGTGCQCWQLQQKCCCPKKKLFNGPYENYDVPKTPMPLIQEHPVDISNGTDPSSYYDTPKKFMKCLVESSELCRCSPKVDNNPAIEDSNQNITENNNTEQPITVQTEVHSNYVNINPVVLDKPEVNKLDFGNYSNIDLSTTLEKFESSLQILRSAGFSQEEIDALEDIPEHEDDLSAASSNTVHPSTECCNQHLNYMHMEPLDTSSISNSNKACSDNISRISHLSDPLMQHSDFDSTVGQPRPSSADFIKRSEDSNLYIGNDHRGMSFKINGLRKSGKRECISDNCQICPPTRLAFEGKDKFKVPEVAKSEISFVARFRESVKIRRSSSVPSKSDKNRDSSSSNDSGVSTGSLKHHRCDFSEFELPITSSKSCKKHMKCTKYRKSVAPSHLSMFVKSSSSDPLKNITFQFEEVATMTKSNSCDVDTLTRRSKPKGDTSIDSTNRISQMTTQSTSSGASDMSDYMESLSVSSFSSYDVSDNSRHLTRPRSGKEYLSIDRALLVGACNIDPQV